MTHWFLIMVVIYCVKDGMTTECVPHEAQETFHLFEGLGVFDTQEACFAALQREQLARDRVRKPAVEGVYLRCNAPTGKFGP